MDPSDLKKSTLFYDFSFGGPRGPCVVAVLSWRSKSSHSDVLYPNSMAPCAHDAAQRHKMYDNITKRGKTYRRERKRERLDNIEK